MATYRERFIERVNDIAARTKRGELARAERMVEAREASEAYALAHAEAVHAATERAGRELPLNLMDAKLLDRLTNAVLHEELTDSHPDKMTRDEYPIMSQQQLDRRREGKQVDKRNRNKGEVTLEAAAQFGTDLRDYRTPRRRKLTNQEAIKVDSATKSRNAERQRKYREFTKTQPVRILHISDIV